MTLKHELKPQQTQENPWNDMSVNECSCFATVMFHNAETMDSLKPGVTPWGGGLRVCEDPGDSEPQGPTSRAGLGGQLAGLAGGGGK